MLPALIASLHVLAAPGPSFVVTGTVVRADRTPMVKAEIRILEVDEGGKVVIITPQEPGVPGAGRTDKKGRFRIGVRRDAFGAPRIRFAIAILTPNATMEETIVKDANGAYAVFDVDDGMRAVDVDRVLGPLVVRR